MPLITPSGHTPNNKRPTNPEPAQIFDRTGIDGSAVGVIGAIDRLITRREAAVLLNISLDELSKLLAVGDLAYAVPASRRRLQYATVLAFAERRASRRGAALTELMRLTDELGLYEREPELFNDANWSITR